MPLTSLFEGYEINMPVVCPACLPIQFLTHQTAAIFCRRALECDDDDLSGPKETHWIDALMERRKD